MLSLKTAELKLGDVVEVLDGPFGAAIVKCIDESNVHFYRPYGTNFNTIYGNGLICLTGVEEFSVPVTRAGTYKVWRRADNLK